MTSKLIRQRRIEQKKWYEEHHFCYIYFLRLKSVPLTIYQSAFTFRRLSLPSWRLGTQQNWKELFLQVVCNRSHLGIYPCDQDPSCSIFHPRLFSVGFSKGFHPSMTAVLDFTTDLAENLAGPKAVAMATIRAITRILENILSFLIFLIWK